jgi:hypothetical protein
MFDYKSDKTTWINSNDYITALDFDYIETYSFNRFDPLTQIEYDQLSKQREQNPLPPLSMKRFKELDNLYNGSDLLVDKNQHFHPSSVKMSTIKNDTEISHLKEILKMEIVEWLAMLCAPFYRDAIVFYNSSGQIVSVLNVCLECKHITTGDKHLQADFEVYDLLKKFFLEKGHTVENPGYFLMDQFGEQKAKFLAERESKKNID